MNDVSDRRILVVYQHLPLYRRSIFLALQNSDRFTFEFAASPVPQDSSIAVMNHQELTSFHPLTNRLVGPLLWQHGLIRIAARRPYTAVVFLGSWTYASTWLAAGLCRLNRTPCLFWTHGWTRPEKGIKSRFRLLFYRLADCLLLYGESGKQLGTAAGYPSDRSRVIYNSIDFRADLPKLSFPEGAPTRPPCVIAVARMTRGKRFDLLIRAAAHLASENHAIRITLVGEGPDKASLQDLAGELAVEVSFEGAVYDRDQLRRLYDGSAVCVIPGAAGLSVIQSLAHGVPVITHDDINDHGPEWEAIQIGATGSLFRQGEVVALAQEIRRWISVKPEARRRTAQIAQQVVIDKYTADSQVLRIEQALESVV